MTLEEKIIGLMNEKKIAYEIYEHEPVFTNPAMAEALKVSEAEAVKLFKIKAWDLKKLCNPSFI